MQITSIITVLFAMSNLILIIMYLTKKSRCPPCPEPQSKSIRIIPELDIQFSENNLPSKVYQDVFQNENIWVGGYSSGMNSGRGVRLKENI